MSVLSFIYGFSIMFLGSDERTFSRESTNVRINRAYSNYQAGFCEHEITAASALRRNTSNYPYGVDGYRVQRRDMRIDGMRREGTRNFYFIEVSQNRQILNRLKDLIFHIEALMNLIEE